VAGLVAALVFRRWAKRQQAATGRQYPTGWVTFGLVLVLPVLMWGLLALAVENPITFELPRKGTFNLTGGASILPEFVALLLGLTIYTAAFIAEIVRAGIQSVHGGQWEAARALGLPGGRIMRLVILPQALRVIIPPLTSQYLNLTKNSSLAVVIGYPDLVSVANTSINQTGQAIEVISIFMAIYLAISLVTSALMNWYNARVALKER